MKGLRVPIILGVIALILIVVAEVNRPKPIDWSPGYRSTETKPLGSFVTADLLTTFFNGQEVTVLDESLYEVLYPGGEQMLPGGNYLLVTDDLRMSELDTRSLLEWVRAGGNALIAVESIEGPLSDSLLLEYSLNTATALTEGENKVGFHFSSNATGKYQENWLQTGRGLSPWINHFILFNEENTTIVEETIGSEDGATDRLITALRIELDEGTILVSSIPESFSNIVMLDEEGFRRGSVLLSYLPAAPLYWDDYYKPKRSGGAGGSDAGSPLSYITSRPALRTAWTLLLVGLVLFVIFAARRRQRVIPVVKPPRNVTLDFVEMVGGLYHDQGSFVDLAGRRTTSLLEYIRHRLNLPTTELDGLFAKRLAERSGVDTKMAEELVRSIVEIEKPRRDISWGAPGLQQKDRGVLRRESAIIQREENHDDARGRVGREPGESVGGRGVWTPYRFEWTDRFD